MVQASKLGSIPVTSLFFSIFQLSLCIVQNILLSAFQHYTCTNLELFRLLREGLQEAFLDKEKFEACEKHNEDFFKECEISNLDEKRLEATSQGVLCFEYGMNCSGVCHRKSGKITVNFDERDIEQITKTLTSKTEGGVTKFGLSMTQAVTVAFSKMNRTENGSSYTSDLNFEVESGRIATVQPYMVMYEMETPLKGLSVKMPTNPKFHYHKRDGKFKCPVGKQCKELAEDTIEISGTHRWLFSDVVPRVRYVSHPTSKAYNNYGCIIVVIDFCTSSVGLFRCFVYNTLCNTCGVEQDG